MVIKKQIEIANSIEKVWHILGRDFAHPYKWASAVDHSEGHSNQTASTHCDERSCQTTMGKIREKITHYSDGHHALAYDIVEGLPFFVARGSNKWNLTRVSEGKTILHIHMEMALKPWAIPMYPVAKMMFGKLAAQLAEDFAHYAAHGSPHPRKLKRLAKTARTDEAKNGLSVFYLMAFVAGTLTPLYFISRFVRDAGGVDVVEFIGQLFANHAASAFSADLLICSFLFWVFMAEDKKGKRLPSMWYFILLNLAIGLSAALPLYLYFRRVRSSPNG